MRLHRFMGSCCEVNLRGYVRHCPGICVEGFRKTKKKLNFRTRSEIANHLNATFGLEVELEYFLYFVSPLLSYR
jgi:hypothetical protein